MPIRNPLRLALPATVAFLVVAAPTRAAAQELPTLSGDSTLVDRVVAVVGDSVITQSQLQVEMGASGATDPEAVLSELVEMQLVLQAAARDTTLQVTDQQIDPLVERQYQNVRQQFPGETEFQRALETQGLTPASYRAQLRDQIRSQQLRQMYLQRRLQQPTPIAVTEQEMLDFFEEQRTSLQQRPEVLSLRQILVPQEPSDEAWEAARRMADSLRTLAVEGGDFVELATEHSQDPGSAASGGDLGWFRRGVMVREFEDVAFGMQPDSISAPVRTPFGYHVIKVDRRRSGEVKARHILIRPEIEPADGARARERAVEVARRLAAGEPLDSLRAAYGDDEVPAELSVPRDALAQLPYSGYQQALENVSEGEVVGPVATRVGNADYFAVLVVDEIRESGDFSFEDLREEVRRAVTQRKQLDRIYEDLRSRTYVDIRM